VPLALPVSLVAENSRTGQASGTLTPAATPVNDELSAAAVAQEQSLLGAEGLLAIWRDISWYGDTAQSDSLHDATENQDAAIQAVDLVMAES
jgi:hypothetical protein